jgi:hypothetical protein
VRNWRRLASLFCLTLPCMAQMLVQETSFGTEVNKLTTPVVTIPVKSIRLWDTGTNWFQVCPTNNYSNCNWERLDKWLALAKRSGVSDVLYTIGKTPLWASGGGNCGRQEGVCYPPKDVDSTDAAFKGFIHAIVDHNRRLDRNTYATIRYWGMWNEPDAKNFWRGTPAQLARMTKDARPIIKEADPDALILAPEVASNSRHVIGGDWLDQYLSAGAGEFVDVIAFHVGAVSLVPDKRPRLEDTMDLANEIKSKIAKHREVSGKPLWNTEGEFGELGAADSWRNVDEAASYVVRFYTMLFSVGVERIYWYMYDGDPKTCCGAMWTPETGELPTAKAYKEMHKWLVGHTVSPCKLEGHVWGCDLTAPGYKAKIVWWDDFDNPGTYQATGFTTAHDALGNVVPIDKSGRVAVAHRPVLLEASGSR